MYMMLPMGHRVNRFFLSSFSNSSNSVLINEANDSERLKEKEERKEPPTEEQPSHSNASVVGVADKGKGETSLYSKDSSISSAPIGTGPVGEAGSSAARSSQGKDAGMDAGRYWEKCYCKNLTKLVDMKCEKQAYDKSLFERTVRLYIDLWGGSCAHAINECVQKNRQPLNCDCRFSYSDYSKDFLRNRIFYIPLY